MADEFEFDLDAPDIKGLLEHVKGFSPSLARDLRREFRRAGDEIIAAQKAELDKPLPGNERVSGKQLRLIKPKGRAAYLALRNVYEHKDTGRGGHTGMREAIKAGLRTTVSTGKTRQGLKIRTTRSKAPMSIVWQSRRFRHPVFAIESFGGHDGAWVYQKGQPYFWSPITGHMVQVRKRIADAIDHALLEIAQK